MKAQIKIGRNDQCPCGSNSKYKNCCLGKKEIIETKSRVSFSYGIFSIGVLISITIGYLKGPSFGIAAVAASLIVAGALYVFRDPNPPRGGSDNSSAINFGK